MAEARLEEKIEALETEVTQLKTSLAIHEAGLEQEKVKLSDYMEKEFTNTKLGMTEIVEGARKEFTTQRLHLQSLYE